MKLNYKKFIYFVLFVTITSVGDALFYKAGVGVSPYEAVAQTLNYVTNIKVGTMTIATNLVFIILQIVLARKIDLKTILQLVMCVLAGFLVNFFVYIVLGNLTLNYIGSLICLFISICIQATGVGLLMALNLVVYPLEGFCNALAEKFHIKFARIRQVADVIFTVFCVLCSVLAHVSFAVREGTVISMLLLAPIMGFIMTRMKPLVDKITAATE